MIYFKVVVLNQFKKNIIVVKIQLQFKLYFMSYGLISIILKIWKDTDIWVET